MNTHPVIVSKITLTRPTQNVYGLREDDLMNLLAMDLTDAQMGDATVKIEFKQEREAATQSGVGRRGAGSHGTMFGIATALAGHSKVSSGSRFKYCWVNAMNLLVLKQTNLVVGGNVGELEGAPVYLLTREYLTAEFRDNKIISSPKRKGKGGNVLTADGKLIFQDTTIVSALSDPAFNGFTYADFVKFEKSQTIAFDGEIPSDEVPEETRNNGFFNDEFQQWINEIYSENNVSMLKSVD